jgi:hypothetical protein
MARTDFNLGNEVQLDLVLSTGEFIDLGGLTDFEAEPVTGVQTSKPLTEGGRTIRRTIYDGWKGSFKFDRQSNAMDTLHQRLEQNYLDGNSELYFQITQTIRNPKTGAVNQYQFEEVCVYMKDGGKFRADEKVSQSMEFMASRRMQLV